MSNMSSDSDNSPNESTNSDNSSNESTDSDLSNVFSDIDSDLYCHERLLPSPKLVTSTRVVLQRMLRLSVASQ